MYFNHSNASRLAEWARPFAVQTFAFIVQDASYVDVIQKIELTNQ